MKLTELEGMKVIARASGEKVATVQSVVLQPEASRVRALVAADGDRRLIDWEAVVGTGPDVVVIDDPERLREPKSELEEHDLEVSESLLGRRVFTTEGNEIGSLDDLDVDEAGRVHEVVVGKRALGGAALAAVGRFAVLVRPDGR